MSISINYIDVLAIQDTVENPEIQLAPLSEPAPIEFTMETPGWYVVAIIVLILLVWVIIKSVERYKANAYRRDAVNQINEIEKSFSNIKNPLYQVSVVLKQVSIISYGRALTADLYGDQWLEFLESKCKHTPFANYKTQLKDGLYKDINVDKAEVKHIFSLSKKWIKHHA
ncbi:MAG: hypothetical protein BM564_08870 [Bacteroidetes bacterium MedPE-SWsnd-G2]|nr:MAG: hypothetical protein BM564_08870 [Bacteroidetes bacterium MedPE-SWsnd-G2]